MCRTLAPVLLFATAGAAHPASKELYDRLMANKARTWEPADPSDHVFRGWSMDRIRSLMGTRLPPRSEASLKQALSAIPSTMPTEFDARKQFGTCSGPIRDQKHCGSCWAFGASETLSDNLCAAGGTAGALSAQDLVSCDAKNHGCNGGDLPDAWTYLATTGIVSQACLPYSSADGNVTSCPSVCTGNGDWKKHRCTAKGSGYVNSTYNMLDDENSIKNGILQYGAAEAGMYVYEDFTSYKSGVYKHDNTTSNFPLGGHALKMVGWGTYSGGKYWLVANSWGTSWGMDGYFKIDMDDRDSAFALGGAFNCGDLAAAPPGPATPAPPQACKDEMDSKYCSDFKNGGMCEKNAPGVQLCLNSCGCCSFIKPRNVQCTA